jgi:heat-inducible transcriptional repressor
MAALEKLGYLEKNHISSGRIPSEKGYKYYVDKLMKPKELNGEEVLKLQTIFKNNSLRISDAIKECMEIISDVTNYTSVILGKNSKENTLKQVSIIPLDGNRVVALVCTNKGIVENKIFSISNDINLDEVVKVSEIVNKMLIGTPIDEVSERLEFEIKPIISKTIKQYERVYQMFYEAFNNFTRNSSNINLIGTDNILNQPEYSNIEEVKRIVSKLENDELVEQIKETRDGINIYIGKETEFDPDVTIIKSKYKINGEEGTIAIVGPKRMEYDKVVGLLEYINKEIESREHE